MGQKILGQKEPRLLKASEGFQGFLRPQKGTWDSGRPREAQGARGSEGVRGAREARPLSLTEDPRLPKASEGSQGFLMPQEGPRGTGRSREAQGVRGSKREQGGEGVRGSKGSKAPESV